MTVLAKRSSCLISPSHILWADSSKDMLNRPSTNVASFSSTMHLETLTSSDCHYLPVDSSLMQGRNLKIRMSTRASKRRRIDTKMAPREGSDHRNARNLTNLVALEADRSEPKTGSPEGAAELEACHCQFHSACRREATVVQTQRQEKHQRKYSVLLIDVASRHAIIAPVDWWIDLRIAIQA